MFNLPLFLLFWLAVPTAIYKSKKKWTTLLVAVAAWLGTGIVLLVPAAMVAPSGQMREVGRIIGQFAMLVAIVVCAWHSHKTRKGAAPENNIISISS
jgi:hypothetical protein